MPGYSRLIDLGDVSSFGFVLRGKDPFDSTGWSVSSAGDINNDGYDDLIVGARSVGSPNPGAVYVVFGKATPFSTTFLGSLTPADGFRIDGEGSSEAGYSVSSAGDINNDGFDDIIIGAERFGANFIGAAYVIFGKATGFANISLATLSAADGFRIDGNGNIGLLGHSVSSAGDINNDGYDDIIVGATDGSTNNGGSAYVIFGKAGGFTNINVLTMGASDGFAIIGAASGNKAGSSVSSAGDINDDGFADIVVGAPGGGTAYVIYGKATGFGTVNLASFAPADGFRISGGAGAAASVIGDYNGDGIDDLIVGRPGLTFGSSGSAAGGAYVIFGKAGGYSDISLTSLPASDGFLLFNTGRNDFAGSRVSGAGDVNGDGYDDLIIGAPDADGSGNDAGEAYIVFGKASGFGTVDLSALLASEGFAVQGDAGNDRAGNGVSSAGDINNDGFDDIIVGAPGALAGHEGAAYVIYGRSTATVATIDNGATDGRYATSFTEDGAAAAVVDSNVTLTSGAQINSMTIVVSDGIAGDRLTLAGSLPASITATNLGPAEIVFSGSNATNEDYRLALSLVRYSSTSDNPTALGTDLARTVRISVNSDAGDQLIGVTSIAVTGVDDPAVARNDSVATREDSSGLNGNVFSNNGSGADSDPDSPAGSFTVIAVNGSAANVGNSFLLPSGAILRLNANGTFTYEPNHAFDATPPAYSNGSNQPAFDSFTYTLSGGSTATVTVQINGVDSEDTVISPPGPTILAAGDFNDTYFLDDPGDRVQESAGGGARDVIRVTFSYTMNSGAYVEVLTPVDQDGTQPFTLVGNELNQEIYGNAGNNFLQGGGGVDYLIGLAGNDTYFVAGPGDNVVESTGQGTRDVIYTPGDYIMTAGLDIEVLSSSNQSGTGAQTLIGNAIAQEIYGNNGANYIEGGGGSDFLMGLGGNDVYVVDGAGAIVVESAGGGRDVVYTRTSYALAAGQEVEVLSVQSQASTGAIDLTGNNLANELYGNNGANVLNGGLGADYLQGFGGADTFQFTTALGGGNVDALADFLSGTDKIALDDAVFTGLTPGALPAGAFVTGTQAGDADDRIIYNSATGQILFDADGNGAGAALLFATVQAGTVLTASDFMVI